MMADVSSCCLLVKGLPANASNQDLYKCLENRSLEVVKVHSHIESQTDKRWIILLPDSKAVRECIKQGSWKVNLPSGEVTVNPDYCSECIVPDDWIQKEKVSDEESSDESWIRVETHTSKESHEFSGSYDFCSNEELNVTPVHGANGQTANFDTQAQVLQQAAENDNVEESPEEKIYQNAKLSQDSPLSEIVSLKDAGKGKGNHTNSDPDETFQGACFFDISSKSESLNPEFPKMIDHSTPLKSGSIAMGTARLKYTTDTSHTGSQEDTIIDTDHDSIQTTSAKQGVITLTNNRSRWSTLRVSQSVTDGVCKQNRDSQKHNACEPIPSSDKVGSDEDEEEQTDVYHSQIGPSSDVENLDYRMGALNMKDEHLSSQPENSLTEKHWPSRGLEQGIQFSLPSVKDKTTKIEVPQLITGIFPQRMTIPESELSSEGYPPNLATIHSSQKLPLQNVTMTASNMKMPQQHAEIFSEKLTVSQPNSDTQPPSMGMPQPITGVPMQSVLVHPVSSWPVNLAQATGQEKVYGGTDSHMIPPGHAGHYPYNLWQTMPPGYPVNYSPYTLGPYGMIYPQHSLTAQHVLTASSQPTCPPPQASLMHIMPSLRPPFSSQPPQGGFSELEGQGKAAAQRSTASQIGPVEEDGGSVNMSGRPQNISSTEGIEQAKATDTCGRMTDEQGVKIKKRDCEMKEDRLQSQIYPKLEDDKFQYIKDSVENKVPANRVNLRDSHRISNDDRISVVGGFENKKETPSDAQVDHIERSLNMNKSVKRIPLEDDAERYYSVDSEDHARIQETDDDSVAEKVENTPQKDQEEVETTRMIRVQGLPKNISQDALELFFENNKRCGGGEIESLEWKRNKREAFITFKDSSVVQSVLEKQKKESFILEKMNLTVEEYVPPPQDRLRLFLTNLSPKVKEECLCHYLEPRCAATPTEIIFGRIPGTALVTFSEPPDVEKLLVRVKEKTLEGQYIQVERVPITCHVHLMGLSPSTSRDTVELYFENKKRSGGGPVTDVKHGRDKQSCIIIFKNAQDAENVCKRQHTIDNKHIEVNLYYECLDDELDAEEFSEVRETEDTVGKLNLPDPVELKDLKPQILRYLVKNEKHKQMFEKGLSVINGVAKWPSSLEDCVIIECAVKVEDKNASSLLKDWSIQVLDKVKNFAAGIEVAEFNLIQIAWLRVLEELQTITIDNPEDVGVFVEQEKYKITVAGPKAAVEKLKKTITVMIGKVENQIALEKQTVTETKQMKTYEMTLLRASRFKEDIEQMYPGLSFDLNLKDKRAVFVGQADVVQKAILKMHEKLQSFVSNSMQMSKAARNMLFVKEITDYIKQKMISQKMIGVWDVVRREEIIMFARDEREVQKAIKVVRDCLVEKEISLDDVMAQNVKGQQWLQLVETIQGKHTRKVAIETSMRSILIVALDDIFQDVFNEIKGYFEKHSVQDVFLTLDPVRVKFIKSYKMNDIKALEKRFESSHTKLFIIDYGDQKGVKITGTKDGCKVLKTGLAEMAKNVIIKEHVMVDKVGLKELLQSFKGRDHLRSVESRYKCFIEMKHSSTSGGMQLEGASGGHSSESDDDTSHCYEPMDWQYSSESGGASVDAGGIKVSVVRGELAKQKVDVIVNSTSQILDLDTGVISKAILNNGGEIIQKECRQQYPNGISPGQVVVTSGGKLSCRNVYHGCLTSYDGGNSLELMKTFVLNCLKQADQSGVRSMAFPALGTGNLGFPADEVGKLMLRCIETFGKKTPNTSLRHITLVVYTSDTKNFKAFTDVVGGTTVPSARTQRSASSNISMDKGKCRCTLPGSIVLDILQGDITREKTDVIVNSVLFDLNLNQGQVSKAILIAGGLSIQQECQDKSQDLKKYGYVVTRAGFLPCKRIIHMAAQDKRMEWEDIIGRVLHEADKLKCESISFPALGTGGKGLSTEDIAQAMYSACTEFAKSQPSYLKKIRVVLFQETMLTAFVQAIKDHSSGQGKSRSSELPSSFKERSRQSNLVFCITIDSESNFKAVVQELEGFVKNEITEKEINSPRKIISELLDRQVTKMEGMGQGKTIVSVNRRKGVIQVSGTHKEVLETYDTIVKYLHNIERDKMKEEQEKLKAQQDTSDLSLPSSWTKMAPKENMICVTLYPGDKEYRDVSQKFLASAGGAGQPVAAYAYGIKLGSPMNYGSSRLTVVQIERVQNKTLYQQYKAKKRLMETQNKGVANEKELWHGTASTNIPNISNNGFNRSYGGSGSCGAGTYFAVNASYSVSGYCPPDPSGHRHIYLASVLTGDSVVAGAQTRVLPPKDPRFPHITYDSTTDNKTNPQMFVIFHDTQAYPSYHITFC